MSESGRFRRTTDALDSWVRVGLIVGVIVLDGIREQLPILGAETMMLARRIRDVIRYDVRWIVHEKMRLLVHRWTRSTKE